MSELTEQQKRDKEDLTRNGLMLEALRLAYEGAKEGKVDPLTASERCFTYCLGTATSIWYKDLSQKLIDHATQDMNIQ